MKKFRNFVEVMLGEIPARQALRTPEKKLQYFSGFNRLYQ